MDAHEQKQVLAVVGPTASGKTGLGIFLCQRFGGEVVSCDSMQVYKGMPIATAQPTTEETQGIPHHLQGILEPGTPFSVAEYCQRAQSCIADIHAHGKLPVLVGGTGLYCDALLENTQFAPAGADVDYRAVLQERAKKEGAESLLRELSQIDPKLADTLHPNDLGRITRALELHRATGELPSVLRKKAKQAPVQYKTCIIGLGVNNRQILYERIDRRVDEMLRQGLEAEARRFFTLGDAPTARQAIGYKEMKPYFDGILSLAEASANLKRATRRYAKRQLIWFRRNPAIHWLMLDDTPPSLEEQAQTYIRTVTDL